MRQLFTIIALFILTTGYCQLPSISGTVIDTVTLKPLAGAKVSLMVKTNSQYNAINTIITDTAGSYYFNNITPGLYTLACFYKMKHPCLDSSSELAMHTGRYGVDSNILISPAQAYTHNFYLPVTCVYNKTKDQAFCPVCKKIDMVKPILWGLPMLDINGKYFLPEGKTIDDYYLGGCEVDVLCNASKHCKRCNTDF